MSRRTELGDYLRALRKARGWNLGDVAEIIHPDYKGWVEAGIGNFVRKCELYGGALETAIDGSNAVNYRVFSLYIRALKPNPEELNTIMKFARKYNPGFKLIDDTDMGTVYKIEQQPPAQQDFVKRVVDSLFQDVHDSE